MAGRAKKVDKPRTGRDRGTDKERKRKEQECKAGRSAGGPGLALGHLGHSHYEEDVGRQRRKPGLTDDRKLARSGTRGGVVG